MNLNSARICLLVSTAWIISGSPAAAQGALWGMTYGNAFSVETTVERDTTVKIGDGPESKYQSSETIVVEYQLAALQPTEVVLRATVVSCERKGNSPERSLDQLSDQQVGLTKGLQVELIIDAEGVVTAIRRRGESSTSAFSGGGIDGKDLLEACCNDRVLISWLGHPFWCSLPLEKWNPDTTWEHTDNVGLGLMGQLRNIVTCKVGTVTDDVAEVSISGSARHVPLPASLLDNIKLLQFSDVKASVDNFVGSAKMVRPKQLQTDDSDPPGNKADPATIRPWFDSMSLQWQISGQANITVGDSQRRLVFQQERTERSRLLPGYQFGMPRLDFPIRQ